MGIFSKAKQPTYPGKVTNLYEQKKDTEFFEFGLVPYDKGPSPLDYINKDIGAEFFTYKCELEYADNNGSKFFRAYVVDDDGSKFLAGYVSEYYSKQLTKAIPKSKAAYIHGFGNGAVAKQIILEKK